MPVSAPERGMPDDPTMFIATLPSSPPSTFATLSTLATRQASRQTCVHPRHVFSRLQAEWSELSDSPRAIRTARGWRVTTIEWHDLDGLLRCSGYGRVGTDSPEGNDVLVALVDAASGDPLAARIVLQRLLPGLRSLTLRRARRHGWSDIEEREGDVIATAWTVIRRPGAARCGLHIAARLLRDVEYQVYIRPFRRLGTFTPVPSHELDQPISVPIDDPSVELDGVFADAEARGLDAADLRLLRRLAGGASSADIASEQEVTERTVRNHRAAAVRRLRLLMAVT